MRELSKYYTPVDVANYCVNVALDYFRKEGVLVTEFLEPSAGGGAFIPALKNSGIPFQCYDIKPDHPEVKQLDFFDYATIVDDDYFHHLFNTQGRVAIGNPPFNSGNDIKRFMKKCCLHCDYAAFILPKSYMVERDSIRNARIVYSEELGLIDFEGVPVAVCFNIYKFESGYTAKRPTFKGVRIFAISTCVDSLDKIPETALCLKASFVRTGYLPIVSREELEAYTTIARFFVIDFDWSCTFVEEFKSFVTTHCFKSVLYGKGDTFDSGLHITLGIFCREIAKHHPEWCE